MFARVNSTEWNPERVDEGMKLTEEKIIPSYQECEGFRGYILLTEPDGEKAIAITLWDTEDQRATSAAVARAMVGELRGILKAPPATENYDVRFYVQE